MQAISPPLRQHELNWTSTNAAAYQVSYCPPGVANWTSYTTNTNSKTLTGLAPSTTGTFVNNRMSFSPVKNLARGVDIPLVLTVVALMVFGLIMLYSASFDFSYKEFGSSTYMFTRQVKWMLLGIVVVFVLSLFDYHNWRRVVVFAMLGTIGLLVTVLFINEIRLGASRTLYEGSYQPSEIAKLDRCDLSFGLVVCKT